MPATLQDLIQAKLTRDAQAYRVTDAGTINAGKVERVPVPHSFQSAPVSAPTPAEQPQFLLEAFAKIEALSARCDALLARNGVWTRYVTGDDSNAS